jgi:archaemetzincin
MKWLESGIFTSMRPFIFIAIAFLLSCTGKKEKDPVILSASGYFESIGKNDIKLGTPREGEWLFVHKEKGQTFEQYKKAKPVRPTAERSVIYLLPIGDFTPLQEKAMQLTRKYLEIFFQQKTVLLKGISDKIVPASATRLRRDDNTQLLAPYVLDTLLKDKTPADGIALMGISAKDLYPKESWNYVFGIASYVKRVGVSSIYRLQNKQLDTANSKLCLSRLMNVFSHEIGHMMAFSHCTAAKCVMNGSNTLHETDQSPNRLCAECQKKLFWNFRYDNRQRLQQLSDFCKEQGLLKDLDVLALDRGALEP